MLSDSFDPSLTHGLLNPPVVGSHHRRIQIAGAVGYDAIKRRSYLRAGLLRICDPTGTNDPRSTVNADHCAQFSDPAFWGRVPLHLPPTYWGTVHDGG